VDYFVAGLSQLLVPAQLRPGPIRIGVFQGAVDLSDGPVSVPQEINPANELVTADSYLQGGPRQTAITERRTGDRLQRGFGKTVSELDDIRGPSAAANTLQVSHDRLQLLLRGPVQVERGVCRYQAVPEGGRPGEVDHGSRHGGDGQAEYVADAIWR
jgi:hypothetical protein